jgi:hypothetical protein
MTEALYEIARRQAPMPGIGLFTCSIADANGIRDTAISVFLSAIVACRRLGRCRS